MNGGQEDCNNFKNKKDNPVNTTNKIQVINTQILAPKGGNNDSKISEDLKTQSYQDINNNLDLTKNGLEEGNKILDEIVKTFSNIKGSGSSSNYIFDIINLYSDFLNTLTVVQKGALGHLLAAIFLLFCFTTIITIFYGETLIKYFEIEKRFPKIARFIEIRRKFQQYYFFIKYLFNFIYFIFYNLCEFGSIIFLRKFSLIPFLAPIALPPTPPTLPSRLPLSQLNKLKRSHVEEGK
jgi:hypothetical protein